GRAGGQPSSWIQLLAVVALKHNRLSRAEFGGQPQRVLIDAGDVQQCCLFLLVEDEDGRRRHDAVAGRHALLAVNSNTHHCLQTASSWSVAIAIVMSASHTKAIPADQVWLRSRQ